MRRTAIARGSTFIVTLPGKPVSSAVVSFLPVLSSNRRGLVALVVVVGCALSLLAWRLAVRGDRNRLHVGFLSRAQTQAVVASQHLRTYQEMVYSLRDLFLGQETVTRTEFARAARSQLERHPGVQALEWVQFVTAEQRAAFEARVSGELGFPFTIRERRADGSLGPAQERPEYSVVNYVEPLAGNEPVLGYDVNTAPTAGLIATAREARTFQVSPAIRLVQAHGPADEDGMIFILPYWRPDAPDRPVEGFVQGVFHLRTMLAQSHQVSTNESLDSYYLEVDPNASAPRLLYANFAGHEPQRVAGAQVALPPLDDPADFHQTITLGGRRWLLVIRQNASWTERRASPQPHFILLAELAITGLLAFSLHGLFQRTARIEQEVLARTRELRATEARLQGIVDHSPALIFLKSPEGRFLLCNEPFARLCGRPRIEVLGRTDTDFFPPGQAATFRLNDTQVCATAKPMTFEEVIETPAGRRTYIVQKFPLLDERGRPYALGGIATDITDRIAAEDHRLQLERRLLESQKLESLGVLAGGVAHDFNNILTAILGNASLAGFALAAAHPARAQLGQIEIAARRAADLCAQMLAYAGKTTLVQGPVDLAALVRDTAALLEVSVGRRARLELHSEPNLPAVIADATQLRQVVMNLVLNAADALGDRQDGLITVRTFRTELEATAFATAVQSPTLPAGRYVGLEVQDNGCGMTPAVLARIFEPFFTTKFSGRGLGLAAVVGIVHSHGGALFVESTPGVGTCFRIFLPASTAATPGSAPANADDGAAMHGTVLVIDDEEPVREITHQALLAFGLESLVATDGESGARAFKEAAGRVDLVLLDLVMPGLTGEETLRRIREIDREVPVVMMSGFSEGETMARCASLGVAGYLAKPFDLPALVEKIRPHLAGKPG